VEALSRGGFQVIIPKVFQWMIVGNVLGECQVPCNLQLSFADFEKA
jgi:hypothetical protein